MKTSIKCLEEFIGHFEIHDFTLTVETDNWHEDFCRKAAS